VTAPFVKKEWDMRTTTAIFAFLLACLCPQAALADEGFTGILLYKICNGMVHEPGEEHVCLAYIRGFSEGYYLGLLLGAQTERAHRRMCYPQPPNEEPPSITQTELVVKKYMADHPEELNKPALFVMQTALLTAFGCQRK
jgi:hypothetical protein